MLTSEIADPAILEKAAGTVKEFHRLIDSGLINKDGEFFPSLMYPTMMQYPPMKAEGFLDGYVPHEDKTCVYVHFPFCMMRCAFCHFPNIIGSTEGDKDVYLDHLEKEMDISMSRFGVSRVKARSILLGGGTPTFMSPAQMKRFMGFFTARMDMSGMTQFSCDTSPFFLLGYEGRERLKIMRDAGVRRLAIGVQAFSDPILKKMARHHNNADSLRAISMAKEMGFKVNLELICGYPGETPGLWVDMVKQALRCEVDEIMIYRLKILPMGVHTGAIYSLFDSRGNPLITNDEQIRLKAVAIGLLEQNGYHETMSRFFSKTPADYSYYMSDWMGGQHDNLGFGLYSMTMLRDRFSQNTPDLKEYYAAIESGKMPVKTGAIRTRDQQLRRNLAMPLKNMHLLKKQFRDITGTDPGAVFGKKIQLLKDHGLLQEDAEYLKLTKLGRFFADEIVQFFSHPDLLPFKKDKYKDGPLNPYAGYETEA